MKKVTVKRLVKGRYGVHGERPLNWDERTAGSDVIETTDGETITVTSTGQQSSPQPGWVIVLSTVGHELHPEWTLFGMPAGSAVPNL